MEITELDCWWSSLTTERKSHIASKVLKRKVDYPESTEVWQGLSEQKKQAIYEHCTDKHGFFVDEWQEGWSMSY